jgi:hypothetical protein
MYGNKGWRLSMPDVMRNGSAFDIREEGSSLAHSEPDDMQRLRRACPAETLLSQTKRWFDALPEAVRPNLLLTQFPRIANALASAWPYQRECLRTFRELMVDSRGNRRGFPQEIKRELLALSSWRHQVSPVLDARAPTASGLADSQHAWQRQLHQPRNKDA